MIDALFIAGTGMKSQQVYVDVISNNISNVNTVGYKRADVSFVDMVSGGVRSGEMAAQQDLLAIGAGTKVQSIQHDFSTGDLKVTGNELDIAISGNGFLEVELSDGSYAYTRSTQLMMDVDGGLMTRSGHSLSRQIVVPSDALEVIINQQGEVSVKLEGETELVKIGELELASFASQEHLDSIGDNLYLANEKTGPAYYGSADEDGLGSVEQGFVEVSNVSMVNEMVNLLMAQRAYQLNARIVQTADQLMETVNNLSR